MLDPGARVEMTVLMVEDSDFTRMLLASAVRSLGYTCVEAAGRNIQS